MSRPTQQHWSVLLSQSCHALQFCLSAWGHVSGCGLCCPKCSHSSLHVTETEAICNSYFGIYLSSSHYLFCRTCAPVIRHWLALVLENSVSLLVVEGECGLPLLFGQSHCFHSAREAQLIREIESISSRNANHVWTTCINGDAPLTPCCSELWREVVLQSHVTAGVCYFWKLWWFQRSSRSHKALWKQLYRQEQSFLLAILHAPHHTTPHHTILLMISCISLKRHNLYMEFSFFPCEGKGMQQNT